MPINPLQTFLHEADDLIAEIEQAALVLSAEAPAETINSLFRAFHTLKGSSAMCGLDAVTGFTHHVENLLDRVREGAVPVTPPLTDLVLQAADHVKILLSQAQGEAGPAPGVEADLIAAINELAGAASPPPPQPVAGVPPPAVRELVWSIEFHPHPALLSNGGNPAALFRDLRQLGECVIQAHADEVPPLDQIEPDRCYFWWTVQLRTAADANAIRDVFIFVEDGSRLEIQLLLTSHQPPTVDPPPIAEPVGNQLPAAGPPTSTAPRASESVRQHHLSKEATVRVPAERLDRLVNLVGEFVMNHSCLAQAAGQANAPEFANLVQGLERLVAELRDNVLGIRMLPIGNIFGRFRRVVHDLAAQLGKQADLITEGEETELDKSILDQLGDPLVHCLRNCVDHGIEPPAARAAKGKASCGVIRLSAVHTGSSVVIGIEDDGRGIDRQAVRAKAVERRLIAPDAVVSDKELLNLILLPGFSTARQVSNLSGRGVGMDVVKRQIDLLRGSLSLESREGQGTRISIALPLTLAIIDGLLVEVGRERFILPMASVTENVELHRAERARNNGRNVIAVRGELFPYIDLRQMFEVAGERPPIEKVVIVHHAGDRVGLVVDRVLGTHQTVIQSLGRFYRHTEVASGATIMGDGRVALILDIPAVVRYAEEQCRHAARHGNLWLPPSGRPPESAAGVVPDRFFLASGREPVAVN